MKTFLKTLKYLGIGLLVLILGVIVYVYSLTFTPQGRLDWGQALMVKMIGPKEGALDAIKKMNVEQRRQFGSGVPYDMVASVDSLKITADSLLIFIFKPQNVPANSPVIVYSHGGGFYSPWTSFSEHVARKYANAFNKIVVGVDYRVAPEHPFPIPVDDCYATFKWVIENARSFGGNPDQLMVIGESAGATLSAVIAQKARDEGLTNIKFQVLDCPAADMPNKYESYKKYGHGYFLETEEIDYAFDSYLPKPEDRTNPYAFPLLAKDLSKLPPAFVITAEFDPLKDSGLAYAEKLKKANVPTQYLELKGMIHVMPGPFNEKEKDKLYADIAKEMKKYLR